MQCTAVWGRPTCHSSGACGSGAVFGRSWCLLHDDPTRVLEKSLVWCQQLFFFSFFLSLSSSNFMPAPAKFQTNPFNFFPSHSTLSFWFVFRISYKITNKFHTYHFFLSINNLSNYNFFSISTPIIYIYIYISNYKCFSISPLWFF